LFLNNNKIRISVQEKLSEYPLLYKFEMLNAPTRFTFQTEKLLKLKIKALFRQFIVYTDTKIINTLTIVKSIHSSLRSESKVKIIHNI